MSVPLVCILFLNPETIIVFYSLKECYNLNLKTEYSIVGNMCYKDFFIFDRI